MVKIEITVLQVVIMIGENMKCWLGVVSREHALRGTKEGFVQVCHGKSAPLKRMKPKDWFVFYSPKQSLEGKDPCQKFVGIGEIKNKEIYQVEIGDFKPYRRDVQFKACKEVPIHPLINNLTFITNKKNWGYKFRFGYLEIPKEDFLLIAGHMGVKINKTTIKET